MELAVIACPAVAPVSALVAFKLFVQRKKISIPELETWTPDRRVTQWKGVSFDKDNINFWMTVAVLLPPNGEVDPTVLFVQKQ